MCGSGASGGVDKHTYRQCWQNEMENNVVKEKYNFYGMQ